MTAEERIKDIQTNPLNHMHDFEGVMACSIIDGVLDTAVMQAHEGIFGSNGGRKCDVAVGPCSCGAWHT